VQREQAAAGLTTIHKAKGLEWASVFVPSPTTNRFPSSRTGWPRDWLVPRHPFKASPTGGRGLVTAPLAVLRNLRVTPRLAHGKESAT